MRLTRLGQFSRQSQLNTHFLAKDYKHNLEDPFLRVLVCFLQKLFMTKTRAVSQKVQKPQHTLTFLSIIILNAHLFFQQVLLPLSDLELSFSN